MSTAQMATYLPVLLVVTLLFTRGQTFGAGRAFPIQSENYITAEFQKVNSRVDWDPTNFLVDFSSPYATCRSPPTRGPVSVDRLTPEGDRIQGYVDYTPGDQSHTDAVNEYIQTIVDRWMRSGEHTTRLRNTERFGCSVRPGCGGNTVVACLFSSGAGDEPPGPADEEAIPNALAFTPQQYRMAERITGNTWDRSHLIENLSGTETDCAMVHNFDWLFSHAKREGSLRGMRLEGLYGYARNQGNTQDAMETILSRFKAQPKARQVGCSVIPDCIFNREMYVVVACVYDES